ncbi:NAD(P)-dependent oxidoreductase [uncultured Jannaschia sp.]|uniref:NAD-dependent epimerase/dehydratase family protein n=1 Tax=uncultured Jannaschia sp. TaxID=293347 RepID=UPI0026398CB0|nr:NAD(P)-dependent oxidoreductase [uncultured Jannaschia sp.]
MMLLAWNATSGRGPGVALLFGTGLVGSSVATALSRITGAIPRHMSWSWEDDGAQDAAVLERAAVEALGARPDAGLAVIWAAGRSGFGTDDAGMAREAATLDAVLACARRVLMATPERQAVLHHVSSAGGLFEGQVACGPEAAPNPFRPYGTGKLDQECKVKDVEAFDRCRIYRPSSVYGYSRRGRRGLIPVLIDAALRRYPARIVGALMTQRDYVHADDVGLHIAARVLNPGPEPTATELLAQARPASIFEILQLVETEVGLPVLRQLDPRPDNARDNTFLRAALAPGFRAMPLAEGIARTALALARDHKAAAS